MYVTGVTSSRDFPTAHATQARLRGPSDGFVTKLAPTGRSLVYSTYLGGSKDGAVAPVPVDRIAGIAVDRRGEAYVTGERHSPDFPTSPRSVQPHFIGGDCNSYRCGDAFVAKLGAAGRFLAGTFLATPADDSGNAIVLDGASNVYVAGFTGNSRIPSATALPPTGKTLCGSEGDVIPCESAFVLELTPRLNRVEYSRILAGDGLDSANDLAVNALGNVVVVGYTESTNFPTVNPVQATTGGGGCSEAKGGSVPCDGFVAIIGPHGSALRFSSYLGGNGQDEVDSLTLDGYGNAYLAGTTWSSNFPSASALSLPKVFLGRIDELYR